MLLFIRRKPLIRLFLVLLVLCCAGVVTCLQPRFVPALGERREMEGRIREIFSARAMALVNNDYRLLNQYYDTKIDSGLASYTHEVGRIEYFQDWVRQRQVDITAVKMDLTIVDSGINGKKGWASVSLHLIFNYRHPEEPETTVNQMGVRTIHWVELAQSEDTYVITRDWYWDPFENLNQRQVEGGVAVMKDFKAPPPPGGEYRRQEAVEYANRYSGVRHGTGDGHYNQKYRDFTGLGGDCANFVSQVLTDKEAGAIPRDWAWNYQGGEGSYAWVQAEALVYHLLDSGLAVKINRGDFREVTSATEKHPYGAVNELHPGDVIGYEEGGEIRHVSVVVGRDSAGYLLVNSHTADRYQIPWDLGWDKNTTYWLLHIVY